MIKIRNILKYCFFLIFFVSSLNAQNSFIQNKGQFPKSVKAKVNLPAGSLFIEDGKLIYAFYSSDQLSLVHDLRRKDKNINAHSYEVDFINSNPEVLTTLLEESDYYENYYLREKSKWINNVRSYKSLCQKNIYNGVDIRYYIDTDRLKYDIVIAPSANPKVIKLKYEGLDKIILKGGILHAKTTVNIIEEHQPFAYQIINGDHVEVPCYYRLKKDILSFDFPEGYNSNYELIIDPILEFSTYSGSTTDNFGYTATFDNLGYLYAGSTSFGTGYPTTIGAYQINYANSSGGTDIAITKYDTTGMQRIYSTYLGGSLDELPHSMIVNSSNELFIYGTTASSDFPTTNSAFQKNFAGGPSFSPSGIGVSFPNGSDIFVSRLSANGGNLLASTYIGGTGNDGLNIATELKYNYADEVRGEIDIDQQNNIYIATCTGSIDFPIVSSFQNNSNGSQEGCIIKMDNQLSTIIWSTYLGGNNDDAIYSLAIDKNNDVYVTGGTNSSDFPTTTNSYQSSYQDSTRADAFITKISSNGNQILSSSYFGTNQYDQSYFVEIGSKGHIYLFGQTEKTGLQLVNNASYSIEDGGQFIAVFTEDLTDLIRSTVFGTGKGTPDISPTAFLVDVCDKIYVAGWGSNLGGSLSTLNLPVTLDCYQKFTDGNDLYLMVLDDALSTIIHATYFGGSQSNEHVDGGTSRFDKKGIVYHSVCAGCGGNSDFPIEPNPGAVSSTNNSSNCNNGVFKFNFDFSTVIADFNAPWVGCDTSVTFQNQSVSNASVQYNWDFGDGGTSNLVSPTHNFSQNGLYNIMLIATDNSTCNYSDTIVKQIYILSNSSDTINEIVKCLNEQVQIGLLPVNDPTVNYFWFPSVNLSSPNVSNPFCDINSSQQYQLIISNEGCIDTIFQNILVTDLALDAGNDTSYCKEPILLNAVFSNSVNSIQWSSSKKFTDTLSNTSDLISSSIGTFYLKVSDGNCVQIDSVEIFSEMNIDVFANDICIGDSTLVGVINLTPSISIVSYNWNINNLDTSLFVDFPDAPTMYTVDINYGDDCVLQDSVFVSVYVYPIIDSAWASDSSIFKGEEITLNVTTADNISWEDFSNSSFSQKLFPQESQCYLFEIYNSSNCLIRDSICVEVKDVFCDTKNLKIPTAFSPNEDNINDTYFIEDKDGIVIDFKMEIFNRLGQKVFVSYDIFKNWDGTFNGRKLNPQVFDFYLELECVGKKKLFEKGNITLIR